MVDPYRFLGFAFASADLLFELDAQGTIVFAVGATHGVASADETQLIGKTWRDLVSQNDQLMVKAMLTGLESGRVGPTTVEVVPGPGGERRFVSLSACRLPPQTNISCAMLLSAPTPIAVDALIDEHGFQDRSSFEQLSKGILSAAATVGQDLDLALIELPGLAAALHTVGPRKAAVLLKQFASAVRAESYAGAPAARLSDERFAVIRRKGPQPERIDHRLTRAIAGTDGAERLTSSTEILTIEGGVGSLDRSIRALRYAMDNFANNGVGGFGVDSLNEAFNRSVQQTLAQAGEFGKMVKERRFSLVFQPVVSLKTGAVQHYETLVRFQDDTSPYKLIRMAEELDLIAELDLAIADQALARIIADETKKLRLAINVSGRSIMDPWFIAELRAMTSVGADIASRLVFEVTESAAIDNLAIADRHIQQLRGDGHTVCLDDFGAGAASYAYLQKLHVDVIKIDGRYVTELAEDGRDGTLVRHLVNLCRELGVTTIAEMISSPAIEDAARAAGVDCGQGFLYGQPAAVPTPPVSLAPASFARRKGVVEQWG
ncbi:EAL domain-containing protein [soil metagenome]